MSTELTVREKQKLEAAESEIARCIGVVEQEWINFGKALQLINNEKLYRAEFGSFAEYLSDREINKRVAYRALKGVALIEYIEADPKSDQIGHSDPKSDQIGHYLKESHTREVADLPTEEAAQVVTEAVETAPKGKDGKPKVTARHVRETRQKRESAGKVAPKRKPKEINPASSVDVAFKQHFSPLCRIIDDIAEQCGWKRKTRRIGYHKAANDALNALSAALKEMKKGNLGD